MRVRQALYLMHRHPSCRTGRLRQGVRRQRYYPWAAESTFRAYARQVAGEVSRLVEAELDAAVGVGQHLRGAARRADGPVPHHAVRSSHAWGSVGRGATDRARGNAGVTIIWSSAVGTWPWPCGVSRGKLTNRRCRRRRLDW